LRVRFLNGSPMFEDDGPEDGDEDSESTDSQSGGLPPPRANRDCLGHEGVERGLLHVINAGSLPHALMFVGPKGVGKATMAFRLARYLLNGPGSGFLPDESLFVPSDSPVFHRVASGGHPDLLTLAPEGEKTTLDIDTIRKAAPFLRMTASNGGWRAIIVDDADTMNRGAQNALLKILEEPPAKAVLILICHRGGAMIPTIRSRCRAIPFQPLSPDTVSGLLARHSPSGGYDELNIVSALSSGSVGEAIRLIDGNAGDMLQTIMGLLSGRPDWKQIHALADALGRPGGEKGYVIFRDVFLRMAEITLRKKAGGEGAEPLPPLETDAFQRLVSEYPLERQEQIWENLKSRFERTESANLDKRQAVLGAFSIFDAKNVRSVPVS